MSIIVLHHPNKHNNNTHMAIENINGSSIKRLYFIILYFNLLLRIYLCYVQGYESASKRDLVISIAFGLMSHPIKFRFSFLQTTAVVPEPK